MLKGFLVLSICMSLVVMFSCEDKLITYDGPDFVRFTDTTLSFKESYRQPIEIKVHVVGKPQPHPVTVSYIINGTAREGRDYVIEGTKGSVTIPANEYFGIIRMRLVNNSNNVIGSQQMTLTLMTALKGDGTDAIQVGAGKNSLLGKSLVMTIDDDCLFGGTYTGTLQGYPEEFENIAFTSNDCNNYTVSNWNVGFFIYNAYKPRFTFKDNGDNTITIPRQYNEYIGDTLYGNGNWDSRTRIITVNLKLKDGDNEESLPPIIYTPKIQ